MALFWNGDLFLAVHGVLMNPIGWKLAGLIWAYALAWFIFNDFVKVHTYRLISHAGRRERRHLDRVHLSLYTNKQ